MTYGGHSPQVVPYGQPQHGYNEPPPLQPPYAQQRQQVPTQTIPGPGLKFAHLAHLPFFVLSDAKAAALVQHNAQQAALFREYCLGQMNPEPNLSATDRATMLALKVTTGADFVSMDKMANNVFKFSLAVNKLDELSARETDILTLTRWTMLPVEPGQGPLVVDVLEHFSTMMKWIGANIVVKANRPVELRVKGKYVANLNKIKTLQTGWTKSFNKKPVDAVALVVDGKDVPLELVMRVQRAVTSQKQTPIYTRFWKEWLVPG